jgi:hypothetical protein
MAASIVPQWIVGEAGAAGGFSHPAEPSLYEGLPPNRISDIPSSVFNPGDRLAGVMGGSVYGGPLIGEMDGRGHGNKMRAPSAFPDINSTVAIDVGVDPTDIPAEDRIFQRGTFFLVLKPIEEAKDEFSHYDQYDHPTASESVVFSKIYDGASLATFKPVNIRPLADMLLIEGGAREVVMAHADSHVMDVVTTPPEDVHPVLDKCVPGLWDIVKRTAFYQLAAQTYGVVLARPLHTLWVFPVLEVDGNGYKVHYIPLVNATTQELTAVRSRLKGHLADPLRRCFAHVYHVGRLTQSYQKGEPAWVVSLEVTRM